MFKENPTNPNESETIIGHSVKVEGDFITEGNIIVDGVICGTIRTAKNLKVGPKSRIFANVRAENALISGEIQGDIKVSHKLELTNTARIFGDVKSDIIIIAAGSIIHGKCQIGDIKTKSAKPDFSKQEKIGLKLKSEIEEEKDEAPKNKKNITGPKFLKK